MVFFFYVMAHILYTCTQKHVIRFQLGHRMRKQIVVVSSRVMRKSELSHCENKGADQLRSDCEADQRLLVSLHGYYNSSSSYIQNLKPLAIFCSSTGRFVSSLIGNPEDRFFRVTTQKIDMIYRHAFQA